MRGPAEASANAAMNPFPDTLQAPSHADVRRDALETRCPTSPRTARVSKAFAVPGTVYCPLPAAQTQGGEPEIMYADFVHGRTRPTG